MECRLHATSVTKIEVWVSDAVPHAKQFEAAPKLAMRVVHVPPLPMSVRQFLPDTICTDGRRDSVKKMPKRPVLPVLLGPPPLAKTQSA